MGYEAWKWCMGGISIKPVGEALIFGLVTEIGDPPGQCFKCFIGCQIIVWFSLVVNKFYCGWSKVLIWYRSTQWIGRKTQIATTRIFVRWVLWPNNFNDQMFKELLMGQGLFIRGTTFFPSWTLIYFLVKEIFIYWSHTDAPQKNWPPSLSCASNAPPCTGGKTGHPHRPHH